MFFLAQLVLFSWPLVTWYLFRRLKVPEALSATILLGYLFIPERVGFDPPLLPAIDKHLMPSVCAAVALMVLRNKAASAERRAARRAAAVAGEEDAAAPAAPRQAPRAAAVHTRMGRIVPLILTMLLLTPVLTWLTNQSPLVYGPRFVSGLGVFDIGTMVLTLGGWALPLWLARDQLRSREALLGVMRVLVWCGFAYSFLVIWESRMSPTLNLRLYGFFAHDWIQHVRGGAFRPIVFLGHGLQVGIFLAIACLAAATLFRADAGGRRMRWLYLSLWLMACLVLSRNMGALMIAMVLLPVIVITPVRLQYLAGLIVAGTVILYPLARGADVIPTDWVLTQVRPINPERADSFEFRIENEDILLQKANQKPLAGWGLWGRSRVFDAETGEDKSTTDGIWTIIIGVYGWLGYLGVFGLLCLPVIAAALRFRRYGLGPLEAGAGLALCAGLVDQIPNSSLGPMLWFLAGALWGRLEQASTSPAEARKRRGTEPRPATVARRPARGPRGTAASS